VAKKEPEFNPDKYMSWENPDTIGHRFKKNLLVGSHKSSNEKYRKGWEGTFGKTDKRTR
jgi:hypothetical protein